MWPGIEPRFPGPLANTLPTRPMSRFKKKFSKLLLFFSSAHFVRKKINLIFTFPAFSLVLQELIS